MARTLMSRNAINASNELFNHLDKWCEENKEPTPNAGTYRYLASDKESVDFFRYSELIEKCAVNTVCHFSLLDYKGKKFIVTHGFELNDVPAHFYDTEIGGGEVTQLVLDHLINPTATAAQVSDFVGAGEIGVPGYVGHQFSDLALIFGPFRKFELASDFELPFEKMCLELILHGLFSKKGWMTQNLINDLISLNQLELDLPTYNLLRSAHDPDPSGLFLSLYRCIEATYAYKVCSILKSNLGLQIGWIDIYSKLDNAASWRPRERDSLNAMLHHGDQTDCEKVLAAIGRQSSNNHSKAAEAIYDLRNSLVHFKPHQPVKNIYDTIDWNGLCSGMVNYIFDIYCVIRTGTETEPVLQKQDDAKKSS